MVSAVVEFTLQQDQLRYDPHESW